MPNIELSPCRACEQEVAVRAKACPHCGIKRPVPSKTRLVVVIVLLSMVAGCTAIGVVGAIAGDDTATSSAPATTTTERPQTARDLAEECFSAWDGNHDGLEALIRAQLNDPGSMETHSTRFNADDSLDDGSMTILLDYGARNALGGMVRTTATAEMATDCEITSVIDYGF